MKHAFALSIPIAATLILAPEATRPTPTTIIVTGTEYAGVQPFDGSVDTTEGTQLVNGIVQTDDGRIIYTVDPMTDYTVYAFAPAIGDEPRERIDVDLPVSAENRLDWIVYNRIIWERAMDAENATYFQIMESVQRVEAMLEESE